MYLYFISAMVGSFFLSTGSFAVEIQKNPLPVVEKSLSNKKPAPSEHLKNIQQHNAIFDDYSSGGIPYEPYNK